MNAGTLINIAGRVKPAIKVNISEAVINVVLSVILVQFYDIVGVLIATVVALPLKLFYCNYIADVKIMNRKVWKTASIVGINFVVFALAVIVYQFIDITIDSYLLFFGYCVAFFVLFAVIVIIANIFVNRDLLKIYKLLKNRN